MSDQMQNTLHLQQEQKQLLSAVQIQSLTLLSLTAQELTEYLQQQLLENPVLEQDEQQGGEAAAAYEPPRRESQDWEEEEYSAPRSSDAAYETFSDDRNPAFAQDDYDMVRALLLQLEMRCRHSEAQMQALRAVVYSLDDDGYLRAALDDLAERFGIAEELLEQALAEVQTLEPAGLGARSLAECLRLQIPAAHPERALLLAMIDEHLPALAAGRLRNVARALGVSEKKAAQLFEYIRQLDPRPGAAVRPAERPHYIIPDIFVRRIDGVYRVFLNEAHQPRLRISGYYRELLQREIKDEAARAYTRQKLAEAALLLRNVERRRTTILRVAEIIVQHQTGFFDHGLEALRPLTLREVAATAELHESTVCRAVGGKYMDTPRGVYAVKFFFSRAYQRQDGALVASACVRKRIAEYIAAEDKARPLSDREIEELLLAEGLRVARRTVAKYRDEMGLPCRAYRRKRTSSP